jgi:hypothetical protein
VSSSGGSIDAIIFAPPRLFLVETPSALAVDLGCAYTLDVADSGASVLRVTSGRVELQLGDHVSLVPAGALCESRPRTGPGTPHFEDSDIALGTVLTESRPRDTLTLWHLLSRVDADNRPRVYDRVEALIGPPEHIDRQNVLSGDEEALERLKDALEVHWW